MYSKHNAYTWQGCWKHISALFKCQETFMHCLKTFSRAGLSSLKTHIHIPISIQLQLHTWFYAINAIILSI